MFEIELEETEQTKNGPITLRAWESTSQCASDSAWLRVPVTCPSPQPTMKPREYCCCAVPLINAGIYAILTEQFVIAIVVGTLSVATPSSKHPSYPLCIPTLSLLPPKSSVLQLHRSLLRSLRFSAM